MNFFFFFLWLYYDQSCCLVNIITHGRFVIICFNTHCIKPYRIGYKKIRGGRQPFYVPEFLLSSLFRVSSKTPSGLYLCIFIVSNIDKGAHQPAPIITILCCNLKTMEICARLFKRNKYIYNLTRLAFVQNKQHKLALARANWILRVASQNTTGISTGSGKHHIYSINSSAKT